ncbi:hypothetical protein R2R70_19735, partial [Cobetia sp. SIMBA_158]|uniref:hypothetical protein n=1 Tax=Cobetia sp. SIMBA_158 TaxID=3081617 RepID=UPI0039805695
MAYKFTMQGILKELEDTKVREVTFDNGKLSGDLVLIEELNHYASLYEIDGDFKIGYVPQTGNFI